MPFRWSTEHPLKGFHLQLVVKDAFAKVAVSASGNVSTEQPGTHTSADIVSMDVNALAMDG